MTLGKVQHRESWRIGLMGATSTPENVKKVIGALKVCLGK